MSIERVIRDMVADNKRAREESHDQTRRMVLTILGESDETLDDILGGGEDDDGSGNESTADGVVDIPSRDAAGRSDATFQREGEAPESSQIESGGASSEDERRDA